jgi:radical SAM superfamily enzyme YgiQ (UPF0313 family)
MKVAFVQFSTGGILRGAGYVISSMMKEGHEVLFFDIYEQTSKEIVTSIVKSNCELLLLSVMTLDVPIATDLIAKIKVKKRDLPVLVGGIHPTITGPELLEKYPQIDYLCIGEGESMVIDFINNLGKSSLFQVQNLAYRDGGKIVVNLLRQPENLDALPPFPWHLYNKTRIITDDGFTYVTATRGCPFKCTYCCNKIYLDYYGRNYLRKRPVDQIIHELQFLKKTYPIKLFYFGDEMLLWDKEYAMNLFREIKTRVDIPFGFMTRVESITPEIVDVAVRSGCKYVGMGIECGDEVFRKKYLNRSMSNEQIEKAFKILKTAGIYTTSFNMIGFPFEHDEDLTKATIDFNKKINPDFVQVSIFYPFPGTELFDRCMELNLIDESKINKFSNYYDDSVLKGVSLNRKRREIELMFNSKDKWFTRWYSTNKLYTHFAISLSTIKRIIKGR